MSVASTSDSATTRWFSDDCVASTSGSETIKWFGDDDYVMRCRSDSEDEESLSLLYQSSNTKQSAESTNTKESEKNTTQYLTNGDNDDESANYLDMSVLSSEQLAAVNLDRKDKFTLMWGILCESQKYIEKKLNDHTMLEHYISLLKTVLMGSCKCFDIKEVIDVNGTTYFDEKRQPRRQNRSMKRNQRILEVDRLESETPEDMDNRTAKKLVGNPSKVTRNSETETNEIFKIPANENMDHGIAKKLGGSPSKVVRNSEKETDEIAITAAQTNHVRNQIVNGDSQNGRRSVRVKQHPVDRCIDKIGLLRSRVSHETSSPQKRKLESEDGLSNFRKKRER